MSRKTYIPPKPSGQSPRQMARRAIWDLLFGGMFPFIDTPSVKWDRGAGGYAANAKIPPSGGASGFRFAKPREGDPTKSYKFEECVHFATTSALVTTGIIDLADQSGGDETTHLKLVPAGLWVALQAVPAKTTVSGHDVWNLPQWPLPVPDDLDNPSNFWWPLTPEPSCL
jgi:hypothetical protein